MFFPQYYLLYFLQYLHIHLMILLLPADLYCNNSKTECNGHISHQGIYQHSICEGMVVCHWSGWHMGHWTWKVGGQVGGPRFGCGFRVGCGGNDQSMGIRSVSQRNLTMCITIGVARKHCERKEVRRVVHGNLGGKKIYHGSLWQEQFQVRLQQYPLKQLS